MTLPSNCFDSSWESPTRPESITRSWYHSLYLALLGPFEHLIDGKHLLIVPSGDLSALPFQVLVTHATDDLSVGNDAFPHAKWLISRQPITVLPSVGSLKALRQSARASKATRPYGGFGNPLLDGDNVSPSHIERAAAARGRQHCRDSTTRIAVLSEQRVKIKPLLRGGVANIAEIKRLLPLPETADEICAVAESLGALPSELHLGEQASETEIKAMSADGRLAEFRVLHFATHGALSGEIDGNGEPGLVLTPPATATPTDDGYLSASEVATLKLDADWVILSACNTAAGATDSAEALSGLARAFFYAGARSLLVSH